MTVIDRYTKNLCLSVTAADSIRKQVKVRITSGLMKDQLPVGYHNRLLVRQRPTFCPSACFNYLNRSVISAQVPIKESKMFNSITRMVNCVPK